MRYIYRKYYDVVDLQLFHDRVVASSGERGYELT